MYEVLEKPLATASKKFHVTTKRWKSDRMISMMRVGEMTAQIPRAVIH